MQGQRNSVGSIPERLQIDLSTNSNSSGMDQPFYPSNVLLNSVETPSLADYLLSPNNSNMDFLNMVPQDTDGLSIWNSQDPNSSAYVANRENHDETKMDDGWNTALSISSRGGPRMEERHCDGISILPLENVDLNLNNTPVDDGQTTQGLISSHVSQSAEQNAHACPYSDGVEVSMCPFMPDFFEPEHAPYFNSSGSSSNVVGLFSEGYGRGSSVDGRPVACKRKNMERVIGESSTSHNISVDSTTLSSSRYLPVASSMDENQNPSLIPLHRGVSSEWYSSPSLSGNAETSQRNLRVRLNSTRQHDISPSQSNSSMSDSGLSSIWSPVEPSSILNPFVHPAEQSHPQILPVPGLSHYSCYSPSSSRIGSSSTAVYQQRRLIASPEETSTRSFSRSSIADHPAFLSSTNVHHLLQDLQNWNPSNSSLSMSGNGASSSTVGIPLPGPIRAPSDMLPVQYPINLSEVVRSSLFLSSELASGHQSNNLPSRHSGCSASTQESGQTSRTVRLGHSPPNPRTAVSVDRQRYGISGLPLSARSRDGRSRMISEIRNALDLMRRGVNLRFEDVFIFDQSGFYGRADLYDRHRDMRLDVDNMSYEELLALEERIGYVSTGLSDDAILKSLRQRKYLPCKLEVAFTEQEPCCICREDYSEGEDIGTLECKHDFHTACIKQWLMIKNLCPICKTTALVT